MFARCRLTIKSTWPYMYLRVWIDGIRNVTAYIHVTSFILQNILSNLQISKVTLSCSQCLYNDTCVIWYICVAYTWWKRSNANAETLVKLLQFAVAKKAIKILSQWFGRGQIIQYLQCLSYSFICFNLLMLLSECICKMQWTLRNPNMFSSDF